MNGKVYDCDRSETVLQALLRNEVAVPYSCRNGVCLTCLLRAVRGHVPAAAQNGLRKTLCLGGYFMACVCTPDQDLDLALPNDAEVYGRAVIRSVERLAPAICRVVIEPATPLYYRSGQFVNLRRDDGLVRSYSLASVPRRDRYLEFHVKRLPGGDMCNWVFDALQPGDALDIQGPNGSCFYVSGRPEQPLLLVGNGSGLAPLMGIVRDALYSKHTGDIRLYHGSRHREGLYLGRELRRLASQYPNFRYVPCLSGGSVSAGCRAGRADDNAFSDQRDLRGWHVFLCGYPPMVHGAKKTAYLAGAGLADIHADPFELRDLRSKPRD